jgi:hypothetical protein
MSAGFSGWAVCFCTATWGTAFKSTSSAGSSDDGASVLRQFRGFRGEPDEHVGVEEDHFDVLFHSTGMGDSISPTILTFPIMNPKMAFLSDWAGTTLTIGVPRLVTLTGSPVAWTFLITARQRALKVPAGMRFTGNRCVLVAGGYPASGGRTCRDPRDSTQASIG